MIAVLAALAVLTLILVGHAMFIRGSGSTRAIEVAVVLGMAAMAGTTDGGRW